jgi:hypothetical protein
MDAWTLTMDAFGSMTLVDADATQVWASDSDEDYQEQFDQLVEFDEVEDVLGYLEFEAEVLPEGVDVEVVQLYADGTEDSVMFTADDEE